MSGLFCKYFVVNPRSKIRNDAYARASRNAMREYARSIRGTNLELANDLLEWIKRERIACNTLTDN